MKQLLPLFLFLLPCLAWAQYPSNGNQKITLGEQTTADGLIYRGVLADTGIITPSSDTSAYIILDTVNHRFYNYNRATNVWSMAGGGNAVTSVAALTLGTSGTDLSSTVANSTTTPVITLNVPDASATARGVVSTGTQTFGGTKTFSEFKVDNPSNTQLTINTNGNLNSVGAYFALNRKNNTRWTFGLSPYNANDDFEINPKNAFVALTIKDSTGEFIFKTIPTNSGNGTERMRITSGGNVGIGTASPQSGYRLHVVDSVYVGGNVSASAYTTRSDYNLKDDISNIKYGLNDVLQLQPVEYTYKSNGSKQLGFIAQDIGTILPEVVSFEESMSVNYQAIIPILTKAIQEQNLLIKALEQRIINLENK
jgi:hypothetical protein